MTTTAVIVEMIVIGLFTCAWVCILALHRLGVDVSDISEVLPGAKDWATLITFISLAILYQVGWLFNTASYSVLKLLRLHKWLRDGAFRKAGLNYEEVRCTVYHKASSGLLADLAVDRSVIRLSRAGIFNCIALAISMCIYGPPLGKFWAIMLGLSLAFILQWQHRYRRYNRRMITAYGVVRESD